MPCRCFFPDAKWLEKHTEKDESDQILQLLAPYHIRTLHTNCWFCHRVPDGYDIEVYLFNAVRQARDIILEKYSSLFYDNPVWDKPEDLCFFQNGILISGSVSHENICFAYEQENSFLEDIKLYGMWKPHSPCHFDKLPVTGVSFDKELCKGPGYYDQSCPMRKVMMVCALGMLHAVLRSR